jgi:antitoxin component YwqK of YwqJK toxin-antitoxin module
MESHPERPASVPAEAIYCAEYDAWELGAHDAEGRRGGECAFYRHDGSLYLRSKFEKGVQDGPFSMFHPNGQLAREGSYVQGELDGECLAYTSDSPTSLTLRPCCVPPGAVKLRAEYQQGHLLRESFFDAQERLLSFEGVPIPERPQSVSAGASFDESSWRWLVREVKGPDAHVDRFFTTEGRLNEELEYSGGLKRARRSFDATEKLRESNGYDAEERLQGAYFKRFLPEEANPYADPAVCEVRGHFEQGHPVSRFELVDAAGTVRRTVDFGRNWRREELDQSLALREPMSSGPALVELGEALLREGRVREALCLFARAAARTGEREPLVRLLGEHTLQLKPEFAASQAEALLNQGDATWFGTLDALLNGTEPAAVYRTLASVWHGPPAVAHDLVNASLLLDPERALTHLTRGLLRLELGDVPGLLDDARLLLPVSEAGAEFLLASERVYFPKFGFGPSQETLEALPEGAPDVAFEQPLAAAQQQVRVYATRLQRLRSALLQFPALGAAPERLPPDLSWLLPEGPVELKQSRIVIEDETEEGVESSEIEIDERLDVSSSRATALMSAVRANYSALCWLCWACGLDRIALPEVLKSRPDFAAAVSMSLIRRFRARDRLTTGGLVSLGRGVPGFCWEGFEIDSLHARFTSVVAEEYLEVRAMFLWSMFPENASPFQEDLRKD